jgi:hypothetical protein
MSWTRFKDMHSGGGCKEPPYELIHIESDLETAKKIFFNKFGHNPERVTCTCCGDDYLINEDKTLEQQTGYERGCMYREKRYMEEADPKSFHAYETMENYRARNDVLIIPKEEITEEMKTGEVPEQGYVWVGEDAE